MKQLILVFFLLLCATSVIASMPDYQYNLDINESILPNQNAYGRIILTKLPYITETHNIQEFRNYTFQQFDKIKWDNSISIEMVKNQDVTVLTQDNEFYFSEAGTYNFYSISNNSIQGKIEITEADQINIKLGTRSDVLDIGLSHEEFTLNNEQIIFITISADEDMQPNNYQFYLDIENEFENHSLLMNATLLEVKQWEIAENTLNDSIVTNAGTFIDAGKINIVNRGNVNFPIQIYSEGNGSNFIQTQSGQTLFKGTESEFNVMVQVPNRHTNGNYFAQLFFKSENQTFKHNISIEVRDDSAPEITRIKFLDEYLMHRNEITVEARDNLEVVSANVTFKGKTYDMQKDQQTFYLKHNFTDDREYIFNVCVYDDSKNYECEIVNRTFKRLDIIQGDSSIILPTKKFGSWSMKTVFNITETTPDGIGFKINDFTLNDLNKTVACKFRYKDSDNIINNMLKEEVYRIKKSGEYIIQVYCDEEIEYDAMLELLIPNYIEDFPDINFRGKFIDYEIPDDMEKDWGNGKIKCYTDDTGNFDTTMYVCETRHPLSTKVEDMIEPISIKEKELAEKNHENELEKYKEKITQKNIAITIFLSLFIVSCMLGIYGVFIHPYLRFRFNND